MLIWAPCCLSKSGVFVQKHTARRDRNDAPARARAVVAAMPCVSADTASSASSVRPSAQPITRREKRIQHHGQVYELGAQPDVGDIGPPQLIHTVRRESHAARFGYTGRVVPRIGRDHEGLVPQTQQVVLAHQPQHSLVIDGEAAAV